MKEKLIAWLIARFTEKSSAAGIGALATSGYYLYDGIQTHNQGQVVASCIGVLFGVVAFITKDGHVLDFLKVAQDAAAKGEIQAKK